VPVERVRELIRAHTEPPTLGFPGRKPAVHRTSCLLALVYGIVKGGMRQRFDALRAMGIKTVMITGDNPLTAASIAHEAGVDDFLAQATPEDKMALIKREQAEGKLVAMTAPTMPLRSRRPTWVWP
jgi:hypothetical protein